MVNENTNSQPKEYGAFLVDEQVVTPDQLASAIAHSQQSSIPLEQAFIVLELLGEEQVTRTRAQFLEIPYVSLRDVSIDRTVLEAIDRETAEQYGILPIGRKADGAIRMAVVDWTSEIKQIAAEVAYEHGVRIAPALAPEVHVRAAAEPQRCDPAAQQRARPRSARPEFADQVGRPRRAARDHRQPRLRASLRCDHHAGQGSPWRRAAGRHRGVAGRPDDRHPDRQKEPRR